MLRTTVVLMVRPGWAWPREAVISAAERGSVRSARCCRTSSASLGPSAPVRSALPPDDARADFPDAARGDAAEAFLPRFGLSVPDLARLFRRGAGTVGPPDTVPSSGTATGSAGTGAMPSACCMFTRTVWSR